MCSSSGAAEANGPLNARPAVAIVQECSNSYQNADRSTCSLKHSANEGKALGPFQVCSELGFRIPALLNLGGLDLLLDHYQLDPVEEGPLQG